MSNERRTGRRGSPDIELDFLEGYLQAAKHEKILAALIFTLPTYQRISGVTSQLKWKTSANGKKTLIANEVKIID